MRGMSNKMGPLGTAFADYMRGRAAELKIGAGELAKAAGIPKDTFGRYWRGERPVSIDQMHDIVEALGDDLDEVMVEISRRLAR